MATIEISARETLDGCGQVGPVFIGQWFASFFVAILSMLVMASPALADELHANVDKPTARDLDLQLTNAYKPLADCLKVQARLGKLDLEPLGEPAKDGNGVSAFENDVVALLGKSNNWVTAAQRAPDAKERARVLLAGLSDYASNLLVAHTEVAELQRSRALSTAMIHLASASNGVCTPSDDLIYWKKRADDAKL
jgi:hypothetical protein